MAIFKPIFQTKKEITDEELKELLRREKQDTPTDTSLLEGKDVSLSPSKEELKEGIVPHGGGNQFLSGLSRSLPARAAGGLFKLGGRAMPFLGGPMPEDVPGGTLDTLLEKARETPPPTTLGGTLARGIGGLVGDIPLFAAGGGLGGMAAKAIGVGPRIGAAIKGAGTFGLPSVIEEGRQVVEEGKPVSEALKEAGKDLATGAAFGISGTLAKPVQRALAEFGSIAGTRPVLERRMPTADELVLNAVMLGGLTGINAGMKYLAQRQGKPVEALISEMREKASAEGKPLRDVLKEEVLKEAIPAQGAGKGIKEPINEVEQGKIPTPDKNSLVRKSTDQPAVPEAGKETVPPPPTSETTNTTIPPEIQRALDKLKLSSTIANELLKKQQAEEGIGKLPLTEKFAGNINLEKIPPEYRDFYRRLSEGKEKVVVPNEKAIEMAMNLSEGSPERLSTLVGEGKLTATIHRASQNLIDGVAAATKANEAISAGNKVEIAKALEGVVNVVKNQFETASILKGEAGRALQIQKLSVEPKDIDKIVDVLKRDITDDKFKTIIRTLQTGDTNQIRALLGYLESPAAKDYIYEAWYNSILSSPTTHLVNMISNATWQLWQVPQKAVRGLIDIPVSRLQGRPREFFSQEALSIGAGARTGFKRGIAKFLTMLRTGWIVDDVNKWSREIGRSEEAFARSPLKAFQKIAPVISAPTRFMKAEDVFFRNIAYDTEIATQAMRTALKEGLRGDAYSNRVAELMKNPNSAMFESAGKYADFTTFNDAPGKVTRGILNLRNNVPGGRLVVPFVNTIANLMKRGLELTPGVGIAIQARQLAGPQVSDIMAKQIMGSSLAYFAMQYLDGRLTGSAPENKAEREAFFRQGKLPWSIKMGDTWVQYRRIEPFNTVLSAVALIGDVFRDEGKAPTEEKVMSIITGFGRNLLDASYLSTTADLITALEHGDSGNDALRRIAQRTITSFIPFSSLMRTVTRAIEGETEGKVFVREPKGLVQTIQAQTPFLSSRAPVKRDVFGEPIGQPGGTVRQLLPFKFSMETSDPIEKELEELGIHPGLPSRKIGKQQLSDKEYDDYLTLSGGKIKETLSRTIEKGLVDKNKRRIIPWSEMDDEEKRRAIDRLIRGERAKARAVIKPTK